MGVNLFLVIGSSLVLLLAVLLTLFFKAKKKKALKQSSVSEVKKDLTELVSILQDKSLSSKELQRISQEVLSVYGKIDQFSIYSEIILIITLHPNTNKNIILNFDKELSRLNPSYKKKISLALTNALDSREV